MTTDRRTACAFGPGFSSQLLVVALVIGCGGSETGKSGGSSDSNGGVAGSSGGAGGSGGIAAGGSGGSGGRASGGTGNAGSGGMAGSGGSRDSGMPSVCPGSDPPPSGYPTCRTSADCPNQFEECSPEPLFGCGVQPPPPECNGDPDCTGGQICLQVVRSGCSGLGNHCAPPCTNATCTTDEICAASGHCESTPCTAGFTCGTGTVCGPAKSGADAHGCAPASCASDGYACATGFRCAAGATADAHGCSDISCTEGFVCPANSDCNPTSTGLHRCDPRACTTDANCDCGACIDNVCQARLNVCSELPS